MKTDDFFFELPERLVAQHPPEKRGQSRLMTLDRVTGERAHESVARLPGILCGGRFSGPRGEKPLLVFNNTKVRKARITGKREQTGAETEFLLLQDMKGDGVVWKVMVKRARRKKEKSAYVFFDNEGARIAKASSAGFEGEYMLLEFDRPIDDVWLEKYGHIPLPPYIKRKDAPADAERYQTVYAKQTGSAAAPTAGLHFTRGLMDAISTAGIESAFVTLHVGLGTFLPVRSEDVEDHVMHEEIFDIDENNAVKIETAKREGRKIIAVGTTSVRTLESAFSHNGIKRGWQNTSIFIYPGYNFKAVDAVFTNFHTPRSTLLMLVSAFAGRELILESYAEAVREGYHFFSYGDAMLIY